MISLLFMQIQQKSRDIAILRAMGMPARNIRTIFIRLGLQVTVISSVIGLIAAAGVGLALQHYPFIKLPDVYYLSYVPARIEPALFIVVFLCTLLLGLLASIIPARKSCWISISQVLRHE